MLETLTGDVLLDDQWQYSHFFHRGDAQDKKLHLSANAGLRGGWNVGGGVYFETFGFDKGLYSGYSIRGPNGTVLPFVGRPRITNHDYVLTAVTPQWSVFSANLSVSVSGREPPPCAGARGEIETETPGGTHQGHRHRPSPSWTAFPLSAWVRRRR